jgi:hypothetical protein
MRRAAVIVLMILAACGNNGSAKHPSLGSAAPASGSATKEAPEDALRRQLTEVAQRQYDLAYAELHPAQQAAFTKEIYKECKAKGPSIVIKGFEVVTSAPERTSIPGTDLKDVESTAVTLKITASLNGAPDLTQTTTLNEFLVGGSWKFVVDEKAAALYKRGVCA